MLCPYVLPRILFSIVPSIPSTAQRPKYELCFRKGKWDENWPFTTSYKGVDVSIQHRHLSHVAGSCRTTRHSPFLALMTVSLTLLLLDHPRRAQPILNGLTHRTCAPTSFQHIVAPLTYTRAQQNLPVCSYERLQAWHPPVARLPRACYTPSMGDGCSLLARSNRVARHDGA